MALFLAALGLALAIEGMLYAVLPVQMKRMVLQLLAVQDDALRVVGLVVAVAGVALVWVAQRFLV